MVLMVVGLCHTPHALSAPRPHSCQSIRNMLTPPFRTLYLLSLCSYTLWCSLPRVVNSKYSISALRGKGSLLHCVGQDGGSCEMDSFLTTKRFMTNSRVMVFAAIHDSKEAPVQGHV